MEKELHKFPSIEQLRHVVRAVRHRVRYIGDDEDGEPLYNEELDLPTLKFKGTVKLDGSNASIIYTWNDLDFKYDFHTQSRRKIITPENDNYEFSKFVHDIDTDFLLGQVMKSVTHIGYTPQIVKVYGEWCGHNIQKNTAVSKLDRMFVIFAVKIDDTWLNDDQLGGIKIPESRIYNILDFETYEIELDFNDLKDSTKELSKLTKEVENNCPVAEKFGIEGNGEGIVWKCTDDDWNSSRYWFKVVGDRKKSTKTKKRVPIDTEKVETINKLVDNFLTDSRLSQGIEYLKECKLEITRKNTGKYIKWVYDDIIKEELDTITDNGFKPKDISKAISKKAVEWFFNKIDKDLGL